MTLAVRGLRSIFCFEKSATKHCFVTVIFSFRTALDSDDSDSDDGLLTTKKKTKQEKVILKCIMIKNKTKTVIRILL